MVAQFADNTVLVNFALIERIDLLERILNGNGTWTATVAIECRDSSEIDGLEGLAEVEGFLGEPIEPSDDEYELATEIRERLRFPGDGDGKHWGEAESIAVIAHRELDARLVTDDGGARREARRYEVRTVTTCDLLVLAVRVGFVTAQECWDYIELIGRSGQRLPDRPTNFADLRVRCGEL